MATEDPSPGPSSKKPRPFLLAMLGIVVAAFLLMQFRGAPEPTAPAASPARQSPQGGADAPIDPARLEVRLEALGAQRPEPGEAERDPFRFKPKPSPPPAVTTFQPPVDTGPVEPPKPTVPAPPPITIKFLGTVSLPDGSERAFFTDCTTGRRTNHYREGESVLGQYRLVKIGLTSVVVEHLDGRGRTTLAKNGQECVWK